MKLSVIKAIRYNEITREIEMPHKNPKSQKKKISMNNYRTLLAKRKENYITNTKLLFWRKSQRKTTGFSPLGFGTDYCWG